VSGSDPFDRHIGVSSELGSTKGDRAEEHRSAIENEILRLLGERFFDGLVRRFEKLFPDYASHVEDVLDEEVLKLLESTEPPPKNARAVLAWRLRKRMLDVAKRPTHVNEGEEADYDSPERRAVRKEMFDRIKALIDGWPNPTMALVVRLTLEAVYYGEILEVDDVKEIVAEQLGHDLTTVNVWKLRSRGLRRLADEVGRLLGEDPEGWGIQLWIDETDENDASSDDESDED
jgi:DNA-directed RNA polymerase specialized sigma24 family protein